MNLALGFAGKSRNYRSYSTKSNMSQSSKEYHINEQALKATINIEIPACKAHARMYNT